MKARLVVVGAVIGSLAACGGSGQQQEELSTSEGALAKFGAISNTSTVSTGDAGVTDTGLDATKGLNTGVLAPTSGLLAAPTGPTSCPLQRWDVVVQGRTCWDLARRTSTGLWTVAPLFPDAPASLRDTHCAVTFVPDAPTCGSPDVVSELGLSCAESHATVARSAECAANPAACATTASVDGAAVPALLRLDECYASIPDGGHGGGSVGGCDACGAVSGGVAYIINPFKVSSITVGLTTTSGTVTPLVINAPPQSSFMLPVGTTYASGAVSIWH